MPYLSVTPEHGRRLRVRVDLPVELGGHDSGPTPTELFAAALASCAALHALAFLDRHHLDASGLEVGCHYDLGEHPERVQTVQVTLRVPTELSREQKEQMLLEVSRCSVHASIAIPAQLRVILAHGQPAAVAV